MNYPSMSVQLNSINNKNFESHALSLFQYQLLHNEVYRKFTTALDIEITKINSLQSIPFLPIDFFKTHKVTCSHILPDFYFESSGTSSTVNSRHYVDDLNVYKESFLYTFNKFYRNPNQYVFLCLLPSYLERSNSSLVYMAQELINLSNKKDSNFYLNEWDELSIILKHNQRDKIKTILLGVSFALMDFAEKYAMDLSEIIIMETGGMKGRRKEVLREELHEYLKVRWNVSSIHSEYGMTELFSQAYSYEKGRFRCPEFMKVLVRDVNDPMDIREEGAGALNIIDLANRNSCAFIATDDLGVLYADGSFEVTGRMDNSALRGCSLMSA